VTTPTAETRGVELPKIDVPMFVTSCTGRPGSSFLLPFMTVHTDISDSEKLVYLRHSLKDGSAKSIIEGLSCSGEQYAEADNSSPDPCQLRIPCCIIAKCWHCLAVTQGKLLWWKVLHKIPTCKFCAEKQVHLLIIKGKFWCQLL